MKNRLKELYNEYKWLTDPKIVWIKQKGGLSRRERVEKCKFLIKELKTL